MIKLLTFNRERCTGARECERTCAQTWFKTPAVECSSIRIREGEGGFRATFCIQCGECIAVCPANALYRDKQGIVRVRKADCVGCLSCVGFCPYAAMFYDPQESVPFKCVSCGQCVKTCPAQALAMTEAPDATQVEALSGI